MLKDGEFLLGLDGQKPRPVELCLHPIAHAAMLPFERGSQRSAKDMKVTLAHEKFYKRSGLFFFLGGVGGG